MRKQGKTLRSVDALKISIRGLLFIYIFFIATSAWVKEPDNRPLVDGIYTGSNGRYAVSVTVAGGSIKDIAITESDEADKYLPRMQELIKRIIAKQSVDVDGVIGATVSSKALKEAVQRAVDKSSQITDIPRSPNALRAIQEKKTE